MDLSDKTYGNWVNGTSQSGGGERIVVTDPSSEESIAFVDCPTEAEAHQIVEGAHDVFKSGVWARAPRHHRADILDKIAHLLVTYLPTLIPLEVRQTGRPIREMSAQVPSLVKWFRYYASVLRVEERPVLPTLGKLHNWVDRRPLGVVVQITPFNHPLLIAVKKIAPALAAGNSIILKPSELTPLTSVWLGKIMKEAGLPDGVFSVVHGRGHTIGRQLVSHPKVKKVDVTGGTPAGRAIGAIAGGNLAHFTAELGGKAPLIVFKEADVDCAVNGIAFGSFIAAGQTCIAATRIIVENSILSEVSRKLKRKAESIESRMGDTTNPNTLMGPLISSVQRDKVYNLVLEAMKHDITVVTGGTKMTQNAPSDFDFTKGYWFPPTILADSHTGKIVNTKIWKDEAFGPVIVVVGFDTEEEALRLANESEFGLGAAIWTKDLSQAFRVSEEIEAGICWVNTHHRNDPSSPWGGIGSSGVGSENGMEAYHAYTTMKSTIINYASTEETLRNDDWFKEEAGDVRYG